MTEDNVGAHSPTTDSHFAAVSAASTSPTDPFLPSPLQAPTLEAQARQRIMREEAAQRLRVRNHSLLRRRARPGAISPLTFEVAMQPWDGYVSAYRVLVLLERTADCVDEVAQAHAKRCRLALLRYTVAEHHDKHAAYHAALHLVGLAVAGNMGDEAVVLRHAYDLLMRHGQQAELL